MTNATKIRKINLPRHSPTTYVHKFFFTITTTRKPYQNHWWSGDTVIYSDSYFLKT